MSIQERKFEGLSLRFGLLNKVGTEVQDCSVDEKFYI